MSTEPDLVLVLRPVRDPAACHGTKERDPDYRLKLALKVLLRAFGLKCIAVADARHEGDHSFQFDPKQAVSSTPTG